MTLRLFNNRLIVVTIIIIVLLLLLFPSDVVEQRKIKIDLFDYLIELLLIVIAGGILIQKYTNSLETEKTKKEIKKEFFSKIAQAYVKIKRVRRILEAAISDVNSQKKIPYSIFETQMNDLIDAQLEFEIFKKKDTLVFKGIFSSNSFKILKSGVENFEENLNKICEEYQKNPKKEGVIDIAPMTTLSRFIYDTAYFTSIYSGNYDDIIGAFEFEILEK